MNDLHADWDAEKATEHLAELERKASLERAIYEAMTDAADEHLRAAYGYQSQISHCKDLFSKPKASK